jgi:hypothetical protein
MNTVLVHVPGVFGCPDLISLVPGATVRFGRGAPATDVDLVLADPCVPRLAGAITAVDDHWTLTNFSADTTYVVENPEGGGEHVKIPPGRLAAPIPFEISRVVLPRRQGFGDLAVYAPMHAFLDRGSAEITGGDPTLPAFHLDDSAKYFLVLVALCEPRLRDESRVAIPTVDRVVERLRPLPTCRELTATAVTFHIDYLARAKLRIKVDPADGPGERLGGKREALVSLAVRFNLVREEHLELLPARLRVAAR